MVLLELRKEAVDFEAGMEEVHRVNTFGSRHRLEDAVLVKAVNRHSLVDVAGDLLVGLGQPSNYFVFNEVEF